MTRTRPVAESRQRRSGRSARRGWLLACGLAFFGLLPGLARLLVALAGDPEATGNESGSVLPAVVHAGSGTLYAVLGAFQFPTALRRNRRSWHRRTGRLLVPLGLSAALSGLWLTLFYPRLHDTGALLAVIRVTFGSAMVAGLLIAFVAIRRRDIVRHRNWMIRAYALGLGVATQIFTLGFGEAIFGSGEVSTALLVGLGWVINLSVAEWVIRRRFNSPARVTAAIVPAQARRQSLGSTATGAGLDRGPV